MPLERQIEPREYGKCQSEFLPIASRKYGLMREQVSRRTQGSEERGAAREDGRKAKVGLGPNKRGPKLSKDKFT